MRFDEHENNLVDQCVGSDRAASRYADGPIMFECGRCGAGAPHLVRRWVEDEPISCCPTCQKELAPQYCWYCGDHASWRLDLDGYHAVTPVWIVPERGALQPAHPECHARATAAPEVTRG